MTTQIAEARQLGDQVLGDAVAEVALRRVAAQIVERQHGDRRALGRLGGGGSPPALPHPSPAGRRAPGRAMFFSCCSPRLAKARPGWPCRWSQAVPETTMPPGSAKRLQPGGDVDPVALEVVAVDHHVAQVDADAQTAGRPRRA